MWIKEATHEIGWHGNHFNMLQSYIFSFLFSIIGHERPGHMHYVMGFKKYFEKKKKRTTNFYLCVKKKHMKNYSNYMAFWYIGITKARNNR